MQKWFVIRKRAINMEFFYDSLRIPNISQKPEPALRGFAGIKTWVEKRKRLDCSSLPLKGIWQGDTPASPNPFGGDGCLFRPQILSYTLYVLCSFYYTITA